MPASWNRETPDFPPAPQFALPRMTPVTKRLIIVNAVVFLVSFALWLSDEGVFEAVNRRLALSPIEWRESFPFVPVWQLLTYGFLHSVPGLGHVGSNLLMLYFFGTLLEELLGGRRLLVTYLSAQLAGALFFLVPGIASGSSGAVVGASGAVFGLMIAAATLRPRAIVYLVFVPVTFKVLALIILAVTVFGWLVTLKQGSDGIAHLVHLGGIAYGFAAVKTGWIRFDPVEALRARRADASVRRAATDAERMDKLLEKIHREGMGALTRSEKEFLKRASSRK